MSNNRIKILSDLVGLEAWHQPFTEKHLQVSLYADVTFKTAYMGGEDESPARFTVELKQAELRIWVPPGEQIRIVRSSVNRMNPEVVGVHKTHFEKKSKAGGSISLLASASEKMATVKGAISGTASKEISSREETRATRKFSAIISVHSPDDNGGHRWRMRPGQGSVLSGKPWHPAKTSLMKLKDGRTNQAFSPAVQLEITCKREDLIISNFALKNGTLWDDISSRAGFGARKIAAEAFIRNRVEERGLGAIDMAEPYSIIRLAEVSALED